MSTAHRDELKSALWADTINHALKAPLYAQLWRDLNIEGIIRDGPASLPYLPVIDKSALIRAGDDGRIKDRSAHHDVLTSGTTGTPMRIQRSEKEIRFLHDFFEPDPGEKGIRRGFCFTAPYHGTQVPIRSGTHQHRINIYDAQSFNYALDVLQTEYREENVQQRCSFITGQERVLNAFALFLEEHTARRPFGLEFAYSQGSHVAPAVRARIETQFGCPLIDRYSMSEIFGGASEILSTAWYDPDPHLIYEVVTPGTLKPLVSGIGELLVTILYPFQQAQPMIRYRTGDLAAIPDGADSPYGVRLFRPMGRLAHSIVSPQTNVVALPAAALYDAIFEFPGAKRSPLFLDAPRSVSDPVRAGLPAFKLSSSMSRRAWRLEFALADDWAAETAEQHLRHILLQGSDARLLKFIERGEIDFTIEAVASFA